mgnify:FL=1
MERFLRKAAGDVIGAAVRAGAWRAVKYVGPGQVVRATQRLYRKKLSKRGPVEILLTVGRPNCREREFIKACQKAGEPFPVRKIQLQFPPKPRKK